MCLVLNYALNYKMTRQVVYMYQVNHDIKPSKKMEDFENQMYYHIKDSVIKRWSAAESFSIFENQVYSH